MMDEGPRRQALGGLRRSIVVALFLDHRLMVADKIWFWERAVGFIQPIEQRERRIVAVNILKFLRQ